MSERPTYTVTWRRAIENESEPYTCRGLTERDVVRRLIGATENSGPIIVEAITRHAPLTNSNSEHEPSRGDA